MTTYPLWLESGPRHRRTMVHVFDLLGCVVRGATSEEAIANAPAGIADYLAFLRRHRERGLPPARDRIEVAVAAHLDQGKWMGEGDPDEGFASDFAPLTAEEQARFARRLGWLHGDLAALLAPLSTRDRDAEPEHGRALRRILGHVAGAQYAYLQSPLSKPAGLAALVHAVDEGPDPLAAFAECSRLSIARIEAMTAEERTATARHGVREWTARRAIRRSLEHGWEHLVEVRERLGA